jgi:hypothetical protein
MWKYLVVPLVLWTAVALQACGPQFKRQSACNFMQNSYGERISWKREIPITLDIDSSVPQSALGPLQSAMDTWEQTAGRQLFRIGNTVNLRSPRQDDRNVIYWMNTWESGRLDEQGRTVVYYVGDQLKEADVLINNSSASQFEFYWAAQIQERSKVELESLFLHELGHVLGLKHNDDSGSVMDPKLAKGEVRTALAAADEDSLFCEY